MGNARPAERGDDGRASDRENNHHQKDVGGHAALEKRYPAEFQDKMLAPAFEMNADGALEFVSKHVLEALGTRTLFSPSSSPATVSMRWWCRS